MYYIPTILLRFPFGVPILILLHKDSSIKRLEFPTSDLAGFGGLKNWLFRSGLRAWGQEFRVEAWGSGFRL